MKDLFAALRDELRAVDGRSWFLVLGTLALVVIWQYPGSAAFYREHLADPADPWSDWHQWLWYHGAALLLLAVIPLAVMRIGFGVAPRALGVALGDWRFGLRAVVVVALLLAPVLYLNAGDPAFQREYPLTKLAGRDAGTWVAWELTYLLYYVGWEVYFRGALLFGLRDRFGVAGALAFQTSISTLVHLGKPFGETFAAIPAGFLFGALALRTRSVLWPLLLHWYLGIATDLFCYYR